MTGCRPARIAVDRCRVAGFEAGLSWRGRTAAWRRAGSPRLPLHCSCRYHLIFMQWTKFITPIYERGAGRFGCIPRPRTVDRDGVGRAFTRIPARRGVASPERLEARAPGIGRSWSARRDQSAAVTRGSLASTGQSVSAPDPGRCLIRKGGATFGFGHDAPAAGDRIAAAPHRVADRSGRRLIHARHIERFAARFRRATMVPYDRELGRKRELLAGSRRNRRAGPGDS